MASMKLKRPSLVSQGSVFRMIQTADEAWKRRDFQQCFEWLERASRLDPANPGILFILGQRYGLRYDYAAAERYFDKAVRLATRKCEALATAGQLSTDFASHQLAEHYFQQALEQKDAPPETFARLAELYERLHRLEDASKLVEQALQLDANCALARLTHARLSRLAGHWEEAEKILRPVLGSAQREMRIRGYYELGAILDRQGRYDEAMTAFLEAKAMLRPDTQPLLAQVQANRIAAKKTLADFTAETMHRWFDFGSSTPASPASGVFGRPSAFGNNLAGTSAGFTSGHRLGRGNTGFCGRCVQPSESQSAGRLAVSHSGSSADRCLATVPREVFPLYGTLPEQHDWRPAAD